MRKNTGLSKQVIFSGGIRRALVAKISEGAYMGPTSLLGAPRGWGAPCELVAQRCTPRGVFSAKKIQILEKKTYKTFMAFGEFLFFGSFFYCTDNSENRKIIAFLLY